MQQNEVRLAQMKDRYNRACHRYRLMKRDDYFKSILTSLKSCIFKEAGRAGCVNWLEPKI